MARSAAPPSVSDHADVLVLGERSWALGKRLAVPVLAALAPIAYEEILVHSDAAWRLDSIQNVSGHVPAWMLLVALAPISATASVAAGATGSWQAGPSRSRTR